MVKSLSEIMSRVISGKRVEPVKRVKCLEHVPRGLRDMPEPKRWIVHAYPIKGGKTLMETKVRENLTKNNALLSRITKSKMRIV